MKNNKGNKTTILPAMHKHRFRVLINDDIDLTQCVITCSLNCFKKQFEVTLRQSLTPDIMEKINNISIGVGNSTINVAATDSHGNDASDHWCYEMSGAKVINHEFKLDYADGDIAIHTLTFKYRGFQAK